MGKKGENRGRKGGLKALELPDGYSRIQNSRQSPLSQ